MRSPVCSGQFRRDTERVQKRGKDKAKLRAVIEMPSAAEPLPPRLKDHPLAGDRSNHRDWQIEPDRVLVYKFDGNRLVLAHTGSHADLFG